MAILYFGVQLVVALAIFAEVSSELAPLDSTILMSTIVLGTVAALWPR